MNKFKVGDRVERTKDYYAGMKPGDQGTIARISSSGGSLVIAEYDSHGLHSEWCFKLVEDTSKHHPMHDILIAIAKGVPVQYWYQGEWIMYELRDNIEVYYTYRIKPTITTRQKEFNQLEQEMKSISERMTVLKDKL